MIKLVFLVLLTRVRWQEAMERYMPAEEMQCVGGREINTWKHNLSGGGEFIPAWYRNIVPELL